MALTVKNKPAQEDLGAYKAKGKAQTQHPSGAVVEEVMESEGKPLPAPGDPAATVLAHPSIRLGQTLNIGNYNSVKMEVSLTMPCTPEQLEPCWDFISEWASEKMNEILVAAKDAYGLGNG